MEEIPLIKNARSMFPKYGKIRPSRSSMRKKEVSLDKSSVEKCLEIVETIDDSYYHNRSTGIRTNI